MKLRMVFLAGIATAAAIGCEVFTIDPLRIESCSPSEEQVEVMSVTAISIGFSAKVDRTSAEQAFSFSESGRAVDGFFSWPDGTTLRFTPFIPLKEGLLYTIKVDTSVEDTRGNSLQEEFIHRFSSRTERERPVIVEVLVGMVPADNALIDDRSAPIVVTFSEPMNPTSVQDGFDLSPSVDGWFDWDAARERFTFTPTETYARQKEYIVTLGTEAADAEGNFLAAPATFRFFVGSDSARPRLSDARGSSPVPGVGDLVVVPDDRSGTVPLATGLWEKEMPLVLTFSKAMDPDTADAALSWSPAFAYDTAWSAGNTVLTVTPDNPLAWDRVYSLTIASSLTDTFGNGLETEGPLRIRTNGTGSRPPKIVRVDFLNGFSPDRTVPLESWGLLTFDSFYDDPPAGPGGTNSFLDIHFLLAEQAEIDRWSLLDAFTIACEGATITPLGLELDAGLSYAVNSFVAPGEPYGQPDCHVARFILGVRNDRVEPGLLTIGIDSAFSDTRGNPLGSPWSMTVNTTN